MRLVETMKLVGRLRGLRPEGVLLGLLVIKLTLSLAWLAAGPLPTAEALAADKKAQVAAVRPTGVDANLLERQRQDLQQREEHLQRREAEVEALAADVEAKLDRLMQLQAQVQEQTRAVSSENEKRRAKQIKHLVEVYSSMKAEKAAGLIDQLEEGVVVEVFTQMPSVAAGKILSFVPPEKAARISQRLAEGH
jgi:flagellar motility protein MotE (MotC chaperone)